MSCNKLWLKHLFFKATRAGSTKVGEIPTASMPYGIKVMQTLIFQSYSSCLNKNW